MSLHISDSLEASFSLSYKLASYKGKTEVNKLFELFEIYFFNGVVERMNLSYQSTPIPGKTTFRGFIVISRSLESW